MTSELIVFWGIYTSAMVLAAAGLRVIYRATGIINLAHGWCVVLGAALTGSLADALWSWDIGPAGLVAAAGLAVLVVMMLAVPAELVLRFGNRRTPILQTLATLGFALIIAQSVDSAGLWRESDGERYLFSPDEGGLRQGGDVALLVGLALISAGALWLMQRIECLGTIGGFVRTGTFAAGVGMAALSGAVMLLGAGSLGEETGTLSLIEAALVVLWLGQGGWVRLLGIALGMQVFLFGAAEIDWRLGDDQHFWMGAYGMLAIATAVWLAWREPDGQIVFNDTLGTPKRRLVVALIGITGLGAVAAYYLDPEIVDVPLESNVFFWLPNEAAKVAVFAMAAAVLHYLFKTTGTLAVTHVVIFGTSGIGLSFFVVGAGVPLAIGVALILLASLGVGWVLGWLYGRVSATDMLLFGLVLTLLVMPLSQHEGIEIMLPELWWTLMPGAVIAIAGLVVGCLWFRPERRFAPEHRLRASVTLSAGAMSVAGMLFVNSASIGLAENAELGIAWILMGAMAEGGMHSYLGPVVGALIHIFDHWSKVTNPGLGLVSAFGNGLVILIFTLLVPQGLAGKIERLAGEDSVDPGLEGDGVEIDLDPDI